MAMRTFWSESRPVHPCLMSFAAVALAYQNGHSDPSASATRASLSRAGLLAGGPGESAGKAREESGKGGRTEIPTGAVADGAIYNYIYATSGKMGVAEPR
jgi:hypothetical protein